MTKKLKIGVYGATGCAGCQLSLIFNEEEILDLVSLIDLRAFPFIKEQNDHEKFDAVLFEGLVASPEDLEVLKKVRKNTKLLIALGACACTGCIPAYRNFIPKKQYKHLTYEKRQNIKDSDATPIDAHVSVDYYIPGCPPDKHEIKEFLKSVVNGKIPIPYSDPVCVECRRNQNECLLDSGKPCLGAVTTGGCNAVCINGGFECWGCRGPTSDANLDLLYKMLKDRGFTDDFIKKRLKSFVGLKLPKFSTSKNFKTVFKEKKVYFK